MEIYLDKRAVQQIRMSAADAIEEGDTEALKDDIHDSFPEERLETIETILGGEDLIDVIGGILDEWSGDDVDELFDLLETSFADHGIDLKYYTEEDDDGEEEDFEEDAAFDAAEVDDSVIDGDDADDDDGDDDGDDDDEADEPGEDDD